jgi:hypothetical protein
MPPLYVSFHTPAAGRREALIGACLEELASCYQTLFSAADEAPFDAAATLSAVRDWGDDAPGSAWRQLELRLADGLVGADF